MSRWLMECPMCYWQGHKRETDEQSGDCPECGEACDWLDAEGEGTSCKYCGAALGDCSCHPHI